MTRTITLDGQPMEVPAVLADYLDRQTDAVGKLASRIAELEAAQRPSHKRRRPTRVGRRI